MISRLPCYSPDVGEWAFSEVRQEEFIGNSSAFAMVLVGWVYFLLSSSCSLLELLHLSPVAHPLLSPLFTRVPRG